MDKSGKIDFAIVKTFAVDGKILIEGNYNKIEIFSSQGKFVSNENLKKNDLSVLEIIKKDVLGVLIS